MLSVDPGIELCLKLLELRYPRLFFLDNSNLPLDQLQAVGGRVVEGLSFILEAGRLNVCLAAKVEALSVTGRLLYAFLYAPFASESSPTPARRARSRVYDPDWTGLYAERGYNPRQTLI